MRTPHKEVVKLMSQFRKASGAKGIGEMWHQVNQISKAIERQIQPAHCMIGPYKDCSWTVYYYWGGEPGTIGQRTLFVTPEQLLGDVTPIVNEIKRHLSTVAVTDRESIQ